MTKTSVKGAKLNKRNNEIIEKFENNTYVGDSSFRTCMYANDENDYQTVDVNIHG